MTIKLNQPNSFINKINELEYQVFQTLKWTFFFLIPLFSILKNVMCFFIESFTNIFRNNHLS